MYKRVANLPTKSSVDTWQQDIPAVEQSRPVNPSLHSHRPADEHTPFPFEHPLLSSAHCQSASEEISREEGG